MLIFHLIQSVVLLLLLLLFLLSGKLVEFITLIAKYLKDWREEGKHCDYWILYCFCTLLQKRKRDFVGEKIQKEKDFQFFVCQQKNKATTKSRLSHKQRWVDVYINILKEKALPVDASITQILRFFYSVFVPLYTFMNDLHTFLGS